MTTREKSVAELYPNLDAIWTVMVMEKVEKDKVTGLIDTGCTVVWGWYKNYEDAKRAVINNITDIWEGIYHYAVVQRITEGIVPVPLDEEHWFKYNRYTHQYDEIKTPDLGHCMIRSIG